MKIEIPELSLIAMVGASSSGKTTFAREHFKDNFVLSSDFCREVVCDDENNQEISKEAFDLLYFAAGKRLRLGHRTIIDATNLNANDRKAVIRLAKEHDVHAVAIVLDIPEKTLLERNEARTDRHISAKVIKNHYNQVKHSIKKLKKEGFRFVYVLSLEDIDSAEIVYTKLWNDKTDEHGPFDVIGDVHGCYDELVELLEKLGYEKKEVDEGITFAHPESRKAVFVGDLTDRGPKNVEVLSLVMNMVGSGDAYAVPGNHDNKLGRYLNRRNVQISHGLEQTVAEIEKESGEFKGKIREFIDSLVSHYRFDDGKLVVSHAGIRQEYIGRASGRIREFCLYGDTTGETDDLGMPVRLDWAEDYRGSATIVYGHVPCATVKPKNNTWCIDTGCVFGGKLSAFRYPEKEIVDVKAHAEYYKPVRPLADKVDSSEGVLHAEDVTGRLHISTSLMKTLTIEEERSQAAFEVMSRFAADPRWIVYLPPTMSPCETSKGLERGVSYLEYPVEAFKYYEKNGINQVVCEKKHMGSRCVIVLCRDNAVAKDKFGVADGNRGIIYTRTGRRFFDKPEIEREILDRIDRELCRTGFWEDFGAKVVFLDSELLPWSEKAMILLKTQYGPVGKAGRESLSAAQGIISKGISAFNDYAAVLKGNGEEIPESNLDLDKLLEKYENRGTAIEGYVDAYRQYCWDVQGVEDIQVAPFHLLATDREVFDDKNHIWHMETIKRYLASGADEMFVATPYITVDLDSDKSKKSGIDWWLDLTGSGGEGMVVKPMDFISRNGNNLLQPAVKCRGREYLRIIYGPEYLFDDHLKQLKKRSLSRKRSLALREFALGMESLHRFTEHEPLHKVHECVFGVLALESEPVDARL